MKIKQWGVVLLIMCALTACHHTDPDSYTHQLLVYMAADNNLSGNAQDNVKELLEYAQVPSNQALLVYMDRLNAGASLVRLQTVNGSLLCDTLQRYGIHNSASTAVLSQVISDARAACPAETYGLILWSHGTGWLPKGVYGESEPGIELDSFGADGTSQIEVDELAAALEQTPHEYICFDACLMANIETYYALRHTCNYLVGSAAEVISLGFPYNQLTSTLLPYKGKSSLEALCQAFFNRFDVLNGFNRSATISLVQTDKLDAVCEAFKMVTVNGLAPAAIDPTLVQKYDRLGSPVFFDFDHLAWTVGMGGADYENFTKALSSAVIYKKATPTLFVDIPLTHFSGLAAYLPNPKLPKTQAGYLVSQWNKAVGWLSE